MLSKTNASQQYQYNTFIIMIVISLPLCFIMGNHNICSDDKFYILSISIVINSSRNVKTGNAQWIDKSIDIIRHGINKWTHEVPQSPS
jgi:hypothetical protein